MKAVVLEIKNGYAAVLQEDGTVVKIKRSCSVGDTIEVSQEDIVTGSGRRFIKPARVIAVAAALLLIFIGAGGYYMTSTVHANVYVNVGDSQIEIALNHFNRVLSVVVNSGNDTVREVLEDSIKNKTLPEAIEKTMEIVNENETQEANLPEISIKADEKTFNSLNTLVQGTGYSAQPYDLHHVVPDDPGIPDGNGQDNIVENDGSKRAEDIDVQDEITGADDREPDNTNADLPDAADVLQPDTVKPDTTQPGDMLPGNGVTESVNGFSGDPAHQENEAMDPEHQEPVSGNSEHREPVSGNSEHREPVSENLEYREPLSDNPEYSEAEINNPEHQEPGSQEQDNMMQESAHSLETSPDRNVPADEMPAAAKPDSMQPILADQKPHAQTP